MDDPSGMPFTAADAVPAFDPPEVTLQRVPVGRAAVQPSLERSSAQVLAKRVLDVCGALTLALAFSPILLFVGVTMTRDGGDFLFCHTRIGKNGRPFKIYKFRTMTPDADTALANLLALNPELRAEWLKDHKLRNDPRVTRIGKFLRSTSLDELPQLWNVLKGDMSLVGPRPIIRDELSKYGRAARYYLSVKPGLTGVWQISGRSDTDYRRRVAMDRHYAASPSLSKDLAVLLKTINVVLRRRGAY